MMRGYIFKDKKTNKIIFTTNENNYNNSLETLFDYFISINLKPEEIKDKYLRNKYINHKTINYEKYNSRTNRSQNYIINELKEKGILE